MDSRTMLRNVGKSYGKPQAVYTLRSQLLPTSPRLTTAITNLADLQIEAFNKRLNL
jgi:E3 ubiquitin-protein ligase DOA10